MNLGFWADLPRPFSILAPMEEVTDSVFRQIVASCAPPDVFFTEFVNVEGLLSKGRDKIIHRLQFAKTERPIVAQIWGLNPENYYKIAQELVKMGFAGVDINMGCPERSIVKRGACAGMINNPNLAKEIIQTTKEGVKGKLPVSVKTRIGVNKIVTDEWIGFLLQQNLAAIIIHGRTVKEQSDVPAHWDEIGKAVDLRDRLQKKTLIVGNGDVMSWPGALEKVNKYHVDGVMIGRGIFHNLWVFEKEGYVLNNRNLTEMLKLLLRHARLFDKTWKGKKNFLILRRFFKIYVSGFPGASSLREKLMQTENVEDVERVVKEYEKM